MSEKSIDTLISDIYQLFQDGADVTPDNAEKLGKSIARVISSRLSSAKKERQQYLRLSNYGRHPCHLWYKIRGYASEPMPPHTHLKFLMGDVFEEVILFLAEAAGHTVEGQQDTIEIEGVVGHRDGIIDGVKTDVKTASPYSFAKFKAGDLQDDSFGYIAQISAYCQGKVVDGPVATADYGAFLALNKVTGELALMKVHPMQQIDAAARLREVKEALLSDTPPSPPENAIVPDGKSGNMMLAPVASYDDMKVHMYPGVRKFLYSNGPRYLTTVVREPAPVEVDIMTGAVIPKEEEQVG